MQTHAPATTLPTDRAMALFALAHLLQALEGSRATPDAHQYQLVVQRLSALLDDAQNESNPALREVLQRYPAVAQLYENLNYGSAGLCRTSMEHSVLSEMAMQQLMQRLSRRPV
jgi:hypothetical protein